MKTALSPAEKTRLAALKKEIRAGRDQVAAGFRRWCEALAAVKQEDLWREEAETFEAWCRDVVEESRRVVYDAIRAAGEGVCAIAHNLWQARQLFGLDAATAHNVTLLADAEGEQTAAGLKSARQELEGKTPEAQAEIIRQAHQRSQSRSGGRGKGSGGPRQKSRIGAVKGLVRDIQVRLDRCRKEHAGLQDIAEAADKAWGRVHESLEAYRDVVASSTDESESDRKAA